MRRMRIIAARSEPSHSTIEISPFRAINLILSVAIVLPCLPPVC